MHCTSCRADMDLVSVGSDMHVCKCKSPTVINPITMECVSDCTLGMHADSYFNCVADETSTSFDFAIEAPITSFGGSQVVTLDSC